MYGPLLSSLDSLQHLVKDLTIWLAVSDIRQSALTAAMPVLPRLGDAIAAKSKLWDLFELTWFGKHYGSGSAFHIAWLVL